MRKLFLPLLACSLVLGGCSLLRDLANAAFQQPTLTFKSANLADISLGSATVNLTYVLSNPNPFGLSLAEVSYVFSVEGKQVVAGSPQQGLQIPASGQTELTFPANVKFADFASVLTTFLSKDVAHYRAEGTLGVETPVGILRLPLAREGDFEVPKLPAVQLGSPRITNVSFTDIRVELPLTVTNRNSFPLPISGLDGAIQLSGSTVGNLSTGDLGSLDGHGSRQLSVPLTLRLGNAAMALTSFGQGDTSLGFSGQLRSGAVSIPLNFNQMVNFQR